MSISVDNFGVIEEFEGDERRTDFEDMDDKTYNEIINKFESEISLLRADRDWVKQKYKKPKSN